MTAAQLKNSLLQEAMSGHLVPQDPSDEPISILLEQIHKRRENLFRDGKIKKKDYKVYEVSEDEVPFELPKGWAWEKLGNLTEVISDGTHKTPQYVESGIPFLSVQNISGGKLDLKKVKYITPAEHAELIKRVKPQKNDILVCRIGTLGKAIKIDWDFDFSIFVSLGLVRLVDSSLVDFVRLAINSPVGNSWIQENKVGGGTHTYKINLGDLPNMLLPLPPIAEQERISAKLEELIPIVEQYGKAQVELDQLNAALPERLRQSIIQEAISGRLVPQRINETANGLVAQLLQAVGSSSLKKRWVSGPIEEDELPFEVPKSWSWVRLGDIVYTQTGLSYSKGDLEKKVSNPVRVLRGGNIRSGSWEIKDDDVMIAPEFVKKDIFLKKNSFITPAVTSLEHLGKTALIHEDHSDIVAGGFVMYLIPYDPTNDLLVEYLSYFFQSAFYNSFCKTITNKSGQAFWNLSREKLLMLPIPLPPMEEQSRIIDKIKELFAEIKFSI